MKILILDPLYEGNLEGVGVEIGEFLKMLNTDTGPVNRFFK